MDLLETCTFTGTPGDSGPADGGPLSSYCSGDAPSVWPRVPTSTFCTHLQGAEGRGHAGLGGSGDAWREKWGRGTSLALALPCAVGWRRSPNSLPPSTHPSLAGFRAAKWALELSGAPGQQEMRCGCKPQPQEVRFPVKCGATAPSPFLASSPRASSLPWSRLPQARPPRVGDLQQPGAPGARSGLPAEWKCFPGGPLEIRGGEGDPQHLRSQQVSSPA